MIPAVGGIVVALIMKFGIRPDKLGAMAQRFQPSSACTFALPGAGVHLKPGTFTIDKPSQ